MHWTLNTQGNETDDERSWTLRELCIRSTVKTEQDIKPLKFLTHTSRNRQVSSQAKTQALRNCGTRHPCLVIVMFLFVGRPSANRAAVSTSDQPHHNAVLVEYVTTR